MSPAGAASEAGEDSLGAETIQLPRPASPPLPAAWNDDSRAGRLYPLATFALLLVSAFLLACSPIRNSDFWLHLAGGKLIAEGNYPFGTDPFCYSAQENWVNQSWLYDLGLFGLFHFLGGTSLAILKAMTAAGLAAVLVFSGRRGTGWASSLACTALVFVSLSPWLTLRPSLLSYLFLALTFWLLEYQCQDKPTGISLKGYWPIPVLFALWVNVDSWFFLGPLVTFLYFMGALLESRCTGAPEHGSTGAPPPSARARSRPGLLAIVSLLGLGACLLNPSFTRAFQIGETLGLTENAGRIGEDPQLRRLLVAPQENVYFSPTWMFGFLPVFKSGPGLAFWFLVLLGPLSFALNWQRLSWQRFLTWLSLFLLCLLTTQAVPFFSIVAGPIVALNWSAFQARRFSHARVSSGWHVVGRGAVLLAVFFLLLLAWPRWDQSAEPLWSVLRIPGPRHLAVEMEPSLAEAGKQIAEWRNEGVLEAGHHGFHFSPEAANTLAWLCPDDKCFLNAHRNVPAQAAADYIAVRNGLLGKKIDWRPILRSRSITYVLVYNNDQRVTEKALYFLLNNPEEWSLVYQRGRVAMFAWRDPEAGKTTLPPAMKPLRLAERAFSLKTQDRAPGSLPEGAPAPFYWWDAWWRARPDRLLDADEARQEVMLFQASGPDQIKKIHKAWLPRASSRAAGVVAAVSPLAGWPPGIANTLGSEILFPVMVQERLFFAAHDLGPPAPVYLAIRAARRALHSDPNNAAAYLALGDAYSLLAKLTREHTYQFPLLVQIRTIQAISAYQQALLLSPGLESARLKLVEYYQAMGYKDLMLQQLQEILERQQVSASVREQRRTDLQTFAREVRELEKKFALDSTDLKVLERARLALKLGLAETSLKILLASDVAAFGGAGLNLELRLLLETGRWKQVRDWLEPGHENLLGTSLYYQIRAKVAAASGDYDRADQDLHASVLKLTDLAKQPLSLREGGAFMVGNAVLCGAAGGPYRKFPNEFLRQAPLKKKLLLLPDHGNAARYLFQLNFKIAEEAKINVLRGLLALEAGKIAQARQLFLGAANFWQSQGGMFFPDAESHSGRLIAQQWLQLIDSVSQQEK